MSHQSNHQQRSTILRTTGSSPSGPAAGEKWDQSSTSPNRCDVMFGSGLRAKGMMREIHLLSGEDDPKLVVSTL